MCRLGKTPGDILLNPYVQEVNTPQNVVGERISCYFNLCVRMQNAKKFSLVLYSSPLINHSYNKVKLHFYSYDCMLSRQEILTQAFMIFFLCAHASSDFYLGDHNHVQQKDLTYFTLHSGL